MVGASASRHHGTPGRPRGRECRKRCRRLWAHSCQIAEDLFDLGAHVLTTGNHVWDKREIIDYLGSVPPESHERPRRVVRPANYPAGTPGFGLYEGTLASGIPYAVLNLQGRVFMQSNDDPFRTADRLLAGLRAKVILVDIHAEATSEKMALGWYLDGRVTAVLGTHTHVPTADERVLPNGTAYQTDVGMSGPYDSVIGVEKKSSSSKDFSAGCLAVRARAW